MPAHFTGTLKLPPLEPPSASQATATGTRAEHLALIASFQSRVPILVEAAGPTPIALLSIKGQQDSLLVQIRWPVATQDTDIFVEGPEGWSFSTPERLSQHTDPSGFLLATYRIGIDERPSTDSTLAGVTLTATLVSPTSAIETRVTLDKSGQAP
jgi:hypothetical protein